MRIALLSALALTGLAACTAMPSREATPGPFLAVNNMWVTPTGPGTFRVDKGPSLQDGAAAYWCAAGDYVARGLNKGPTTEIFRMSKPPQRGGAGVLFSLNGAGAQPSGVMRLGNQNEGFTAGAATGSFCMKVPPIPFFQ